MRIEIAQRRLFFYVPLILHTENEKAGEVIAGLIDV
jgi:hypothetical protein